MRSRSFFHLGDRRVSSWLLCGAVIVACSSDDASTATPDGGASSDATVPVDGGVADAGHANDSSVTTFDGSGATDTGTTSPVDSGLPAACNGTLASTSTPATNLPAVPPFTLPSGFVIETVATIGSARELAALPNGDLLVATSGDTVYIVPNAEAAGAPGAPVPFTVIADAPVQGVAFDGPSCTVYVASHAEIHVMAYSDAQMSAPAGDAIAHVRTGDIAPNSDGDVHTTTSVGVAQGIVYAGVGSSCNACKETDGTRATVQAMNRDGSQMTTRATRFRNAIAIATNPATGTLWAGGAGQDTVAAGHPFEFFDAVTLHPGVADYGWPDCEENHHAYTSGANCAAQAVPLIEFPPYSTLIGAAFYPASAPGARAHAFPADYRGGLFVAAHGSWHTNGNAYYSPPRVAFVAMNGDVPKIAVDWNDPSKQWTEFVGGYQLADGTSRIGRPTGIAVGAQGSLFIADDKNGAVYRIRPE